MVEPTHDEGLVDLSFVEYEKIWQWGTKSIMARGTESCEKHKFDTDKNIGRISCLEKLAGTRTVMLMKKCRKCRIK